MRLYLWCIAVAAACSLANAATARSRPPEAIVSVLVDLSATWHNRGSLAYNNQLLGSVGRSIGSAAVSMPKPLSVRYHIIGTASLGRQPICRVDFAPSLLGFGAAEPFVQRDRLAFSKYLSADCPAHTLRQAPEPTTEITAAILAAKEAMALTPASVPRVYIIMSDFREEGPSGFTLKGVNFNRSRVILLWRTLREDKIDPAQLSARVKLWKDELARHGARVSAFSDSAAIASPDDLVRLIGSTG